jgi:glycosyltransferase involved in cell wall biosynthesis
MNKILFNFSASYSGGGYKRLYEYASWFDSNGGAIFIVNKVNSEFTKTFQNNKYYYINTSKIQRIFFDCKYLRKIIIENGQIEFYYSYGIPIYYKVALLNWFHLSNVLPLSPLSISMSLYNRLRFLYLGFKIRKGFAFSDIISAESRYSLSLISPKYSSKLFLSQNGSDDEIKYLTTPSSTIKKDFALIIGTQWYKAIDDAYKIFLMLKEKEINLNLIIIGDPKHLKNNIKNNTSVKIINSFLQRDILINEYLSKCKYYINTTLLENSFNAASEGIVFAEESFISDIDPHLELLGPIKLAKLDILPNNRKIIHIKRENVNSSNMKTWHEIISEMIIHKEKLLELSGK